LQNYGAAVLGDYQTPGSASGTNSEMLELLSALYNGEMRPVRRPEPDTDIGHMLPYRRATFGLDAMELRGAGDPDFASIIGLKDYPEATSPGLLDGLRTDGGTKAHVLAVNKTLTGVRTDATAEVYKKLNLTKTRIRQDITTTRATYGNPAGRLIARGKPVGLISFSGTRAVKKGVSVLVRRDATRKILPHAFIATAKTAQNVWWRGWTGPRQPVRPTINYARLPRQYRHPIHRLTGPRIEDILADPEVMYTVEDKGWDRYQKNIDYEVQRVLDRYK
jgi:hypothetical protein